MTNIFQFCQQAAVEQARGRHDYSFLCVFPGRP
jgi:hypothetical protein